MAIHIKNYMLDGFRGIDNLKIDRLNHINIIAGDNNCGKTSVLESILFFANPQELANVLSVARLRDQIAVMPYSNLTYNNFINLFSKNNDEMCIEAQAVYENHNIQFKLFGVQKRIMLSLDDLDKSTLRMLDTKTMADLSEAMAFSGDLYCRIGDREVSKKIELHEYSSSSFMRKKESRLPKIQYLSPISHITGNNFDEVIRNDNYKEICIRILQIFDSNITDLLLLKGENTNRTIEYVKHKVYGNMPISTYGDGIKKVISLANAIAKANNGILLIDEVETAIHSKYYNDIFAFIVKAAIQFDVQVFITTHSIEAIDSFLQTQNYNDSANDNISVITLKKSIDKTLSRVLSGRQTYENRENFDFEVRI